MSGEGAAEEVDDDRTAGNADLRRYKRRLQALVQQFRDLQEEFEDIGCQNEIAVLGAMPDGSLIKYLSEYAISDSVVSNAADDFACVLLGSKGRRQGSEKLKQARILIITYYYVLCFFPLLFHI